MKRYTLIVGDAATWEEGGIGFITFQAIDQITTHDSLAEAEAAGEAALQAGKDTWVVPQAFDGIIYFEKENLS